MKKKFNDCPLGTRFSYLPSMDDAPTRVYVILSHHGDDGCGRVARWSGEDGPISAQQVFSAAESECLRTDLVINTIVWTPLRKPQ